MSYTAEIVSVFISSPGDVSADRAGVIDAVMRWNQRNGRARGIFFNPLTWESLVAPDIGESGQGVIESQIGNDYDIYLGLMWARFGSPTSNAQSGTEDEFLKAVKRYEGGEDLVVSFLFKNTPISPGNMDSGQLKKVEEFKNLVSNSGCLYREYNDENALNTTVNLILDRFANTNSKLGFENFKFSEDLQKNSGQKSEGRPLDDEFGVIDYQEMAEKYTAIFLEISSEWARKLQDLGSRASKATEDLNTISRFGKIEASTMKPIVNGLADFIDATAEWGEARQTQLDECLESLAVALNGLVNVSSDFEQEVGEKDEAVTAVNSLIEAIESTNKSTKELSQTVLSLPRMTAKLNRANKRISAALNGMIQNNENFLSNLLIMREEISKQLT